MLDHVFFKEGQKITAGAVRILEIQLGAIVPVATETPVRGATGRAHAGAQCGHPSAVDGGSQARGSHTQCRAETGIVTFSLRYRLPCSFAPEL